MGVIRRGLLGGFSGRVGNIVGSSWKGIAVIKSLPLSVANPRTTGQVAQRTAFADTVGFASLLLSQFLKPLWDRFASQMSGYNAFVSANVELYSPGLGAHFVGMVASQGKIPSLSNLVFTRDAANDKVVITWDTAISGSYEANDDVIKCFVYSDTLPGIAFPAADAVRSDGTVDVPCEFDISGMSTLSGAAVPLSANGYNAGADLVKVIG